MPYRLVCFHSWPDVRVEKIRVHWTTMRFSRLLSQYVANRAGTISDLLPKRPEAGNLQKLLQNLMMRWTVGEAESHAVSRKEG